MALTYERAKDVAVAIQSVATKLRNLKSELQAILDYNSHQAIDWGAAELPTYIQQDASSNLDGLKYSRQAVSNAVGSLATINAAIDSAAMGNLNQICDPE